MHIEGITVCVNFDDLFALSIERWANALDHIIVVTDTTDERIGDLVAPYQNITLYRTDIFYKNGAMFNKGAAVEESLDMAYLRDWVLFFDGDIVPPEDLRQRIEQENPQCGTLYNAPRYQCNNLDLLNHAIRNWDMMKLFRIDDREFPGYFQLFHSKDANVQQRPLLETNWKSAASYDSVFQWKWDGEHKHRFNFPLIHCGPHGTNWCGRAIERWDGIPVDDLEKNRKAIKELFHARFTNNGHQHEKIQ